MLNVTKLSKEEMKLIFASTVGGPNNGGNVNCGSEPDAILYPQIHQYWVDCMESKSSGKPVICPPGDNTQTP